MKAGAFLKKIKYRLRGRVITLTPPGKARGRVLLSHDITAFFRPAGDPLGGHGHYWVARDMADAFLELGYCVDIISWNNTRFIPTKNYAYCLDIDTNLGRIAPYLNSDCVKIFHATGAHWLFQNTSEYERCLAIQRRRGVSLIPRRQVMPSYSIEAADVGIFFGNEFTKNTYAYAHKTMHPVPMPTTNAYPFPEHKEYGSARKNFLWVGGVGAVHKGLDLVLEAFAGMPEFTLTVCGKVDKEEDFANAYRHELYDVPTITLAGHVDTGGSAFKELCEKSIGIVFASCSEGQPGSVVVGMHAGLIPIVSRESGISAEEYGVVLKENSVAHIQEAVRSVALLPEAELRDRSRAAWEYANAHYTRESFAQTFRNFLRTLESA